MMSYRACQTKLREKRRRQRETERDREKRSQDQEGWDLQGSGEWRVGMDFTSK